jgi:stress response protein SCP2
MVNIPMDAKGAVTVSDMTHGDAGMFSRTESTRVQAAFDLYSNNVNRTSSRQGNGNSSQVVNRACAGGNSSSTVSGGNPSRPVNNPARPMNNPARPVNNPARPANNPARPMNNPARPIQRSSPSPVNSTGPKGRSLRKGEKASLTGENPNIDQIDIGLGWELTSQGSRYDLDVEAFMLGQNGKVIGDSWFVFYNQIASPDGSVKILENINSDKRVVRVKLKSVNNQVNKIVFVITINEARQMGYNFSNVCNAYVRIVDKQSNKELFRFELTDYYNNVCSMMVGEVYRRNNEWKFSPIGDGTGDDLLGLCLRYGVNTDG